MMFILDFFSEVVMSYVCPSNVNGLAWRQEICTQLARAWDKGARRVNNNWTLLLTIAVQIEPVAMLSLKQASS